MPRLHSVELLPDDAGADVVRRAWQALRDSGLPSMLDHTGGTNTPHVTVIEVPAISGADEDLAVELLAPLLPVTVSLSGLVVLGGARVTLARLVDVPDDVVAAVLRLRAGTRGHPHPGWLPHVTLVRRLPRTDVTAALDALAGVTDPGGDTVTLTHLRRWDPDAEVVRRLGPR
jgi:hypothetical protein